ncbi:hypothetical protein F1D61_32635 (plasmid) [Methylobacterium aquaticum]|jgi:hypothetical protein|nr:hypothetical protein F1D61_32635 [Methylobacterium aquaticum]
MARLEHHSWGQRNAGRRHWVKPAVQAAARRVFVMAIGAIVAGACCGFVARELFESRVLMTPYLAR